MPNCRAPHSRRSENEGRHVLFDAEPGRFRVHGEPSRLERVISNLLDNSVSLSPPDGAITIDLARADNWITLSVCDEGPGIPEARREQVFQRFHSHRPQAEDFGNHSGLGLAIARSIAEAHDGTLLATSRMDGQSGACLELGLPKKR